MITTIAPPTCRNCGTPGADPAQRHLCGRCYADGPTRSCFSFDGRRIATAPVLPRRQEVEAHSPTPWPEQPEPAKRPRLPHSRGPQSEAADDDALLAVVDRLIAEGRYQTPEGIAVAGQQAALRAAGLTQHRCEEAVERMVLAGVLRRVTARVVKFQVGRAGGRNAAALQRVTGR